MTLLLAVGAVALFLALPVSAQPPADPGGDAVITVEFADDDMGFNATSSKDISNIYVVLCDESLHKHDDLTGHHFNHTEDQKIAGVYVKSGDNGIEGNDPPGAGEFFENEGVQCDSTTSSTSDTETTTSTTETSGSDTRTETEEIPVFGSGTALLLGVGGALAGAMLMLRRKL